MKNTISWLSEPLGRESRQIQYPYVLMSSGSAWEVVFVQTDRPRRVTFLKTERSALDYIGRRNRHWQLENKAWIESRALLFRIAQESQRQSPQPFGRSVLRGVRSMLIAFGVKRG
jgi:hypothetical protein